MKVFIIIAVLAALTICHVASTIQNDADENEEDIAVFQEIGQLYQKDYSRDGVSGRLLSDDDLILFHEYSFFMAGIANTVQFRDVVFRGNSTTRISRIRVYNPPVIPGHTHIRNMNTYAIVKFRSAPGGALSCRVQFFGEYIDQD